MAFRLKDRNRQIPHGLRFLQPETNWRPARFSSFSTIVSGLISHRRRHPDLAEKGKWKMDIKEVEDEVDEYNAWYCMQMGWNDYVHGNEGVAPDPKPQALLEQERREVAVAASRAQKIWSGVRTLNDWIDSGTPPVAMEVSEARANVCAKCPKNGKGDFTSWFTKPASDAIAFQIQRKRGMKLATTVDGQLNVCEVCLCPLELKVHTPLSFIDNHLKPEVRVELAKVVQTIDKKPMQCWITAELK